VLYVIKFNMVEGYWNVRLQHINELTDKKMDDEGMPKSQIIEEVAALRNRLDALVDAEIQCREAEEALKKERDFTSAIIDTAGALVVVLDPEGRIVRFNKACERTTGYSGEETQGEYFWDLLLVPEEVESVREVFMELRSGHFPNRHDNFWLTKEGNRRLISWSNTSLLGDDGSVLYVIGTGIDITDLRALEREKANLMSMFAHDMRSALTIIHGFMKRLITKADNDEDRYQYFEIITKEAGKLEFLVDDFLEFSQLQAGKLILHFAPTRLGDELKGLIKAYQTKAMQSGTVLKDENLDSVPLIEADANRLHRVFTNLLDNALKFSNGQGTVTIAGQAHDDYVSVQIKDEGIGIDPTDLPYIFDPFHRSQSNEKYDGYGVGLAAVKTIVEGHGGQILVESEIGKGSSFTIILPKAKPNK
jgi:PAS domain S-box-containing protein